MDDRRTPKPTRTRKIVKERSCASPSSKVWQGAIVRDARYWKRLENYQRVLCFVDVTGRELRWSAVRQGRVQEWKYLRDFGVYEKLMNAVRSPSAKSPQSTRSGSTQTQQSGREPVQIRSRLVARASQSGDGPDRYAGSPPLKGGRH